MSAQFTRLQFTLYQRAEPQGSARAFLIAGRAHITSDSKKLRPFRSDLTRMAKAELAEMNIEEPMFAPQVPVRVVVDCGFIRPKSAKKRTHPATRPDVDKLARGILDGLTGVAFADDAQVVVLEVRKTYQPQDRVTVLVEREGA